MSCDKINEPVLFRSGFFYALKPGTMQQHYDQYTAADHKVWQILFERQTDNLQDKACGDYLKCLGQLSPVLKPDRIPDFRQLDEILESLTGWTIEVVPGHIPVRAFFELLAQRKFPSSTWLRSMDQLDYLEEPDMFHDIYGHIPLLAEPAYAGFMRSIGEFACQMESDKVISTLRSLYWFTIEFGLVREGGQRRIYGAGILSSFGESKQVVQSNIECFPFDIARILHTDFRTDVMQSMYFEADGMSEFLGSLESAEELLKRSLVKSQR